MTKSKKIKVENPIIKEIKSSIDKKTIIIGTEKTIKELKKGKVKKVILSLNCPKDVKETIEYYSKISEIKIVESGQTNEELGEICKKPFNISVIGIQ